ncbi:Ff.00g008780.m01.CDS01 [Fusarium sp. VM40]|nr:Ff.00g008780.m01.CDS01 [Fusarium sp. VM40]
MADMTGGMAALVAGIAESNLNASALAQGALNSIVVVESDVAKLRKEIADADVRDTTQLNLHKGAIAKLILTSKSLDEKMLEIKKGLEASNTRLETVESQLKALAHKQSTPIFHTGALDGKAIKPQMIMSSHLHPSAQDDYFDRFISNPENRDMLIKSLFSNINLTLEPSATPTADTTASKTNSAPAQVPANQGGPSAPAVMAPTPTTKLRLKVKATTPAKRRATSPASEPQSPPKRRVVPPLIRRERDLWAGRRP